MALQYAGTMNRNRERKPLMKKRDSRMKKAMKSIMESGREHRPMMPYPRKEERRW